MLQMLHNESSEGKILIIFQVTQPVSGSLNPSVKTVKGKEANVNSQQLGL